ncbi:hypothetical protein JTB14_006710 [Gonioctena quinquepunctata]|nr:hypothetical protein JTB14_006710 [Gonioctena quinquepunctata]
MIVEFLMLTDVNDNAIIFTEDDFDQMPILFEGDLDYPESTFNSPLLDEIDYCQDKSEKEETNQNETNNVSVLSETVFRVDSGRNFEDFLLKMKNLREKTKRKQSVIRYIINSVLTTTEKKEKE